MKQGKFNVDGGKYYKGYTDGTTWNGWEYPYFEQKVGMEIAKDFSDDTLAISYNKETDSFVMMVYDEDEFVYVAKAKEIDGKKLYNFGEFAICWDMEQ